MQKNNVKNMLFCRSPVKLVNNVNVLICSMFICKFFPPKSAQKLVSELRIQSKYIVPQRNPNLWSHTLDQARSVQNYHCSPCLDKAQYNQLYKPNLQSFWKYFCMCHSQWLRIRYKVLADDHLHISWNLSSFWQIIHNKPTQILLQHFSLWFICRDYSA